VDVSGERKASGVNPEEKSGVGVPKAVQGCTTAQFWQLLRRHHNQAVSASALPLDLAMTWRRGTCCVGNSLFPDFIYPGCMHCRGHYSYAD